MNSRIFDHKGRSVSFTDLCFGPQVPGSKLFSERNYQEAWFNKLGMGEQYSPFFQLNRAIYAEFRAQMKVQMVLAIKTLDVRGDHPEGLSILEFIWDRNLGQELTIPESPWLKYTKADDEFSHLQHRYDGDIFPDKEEEEKILRDFCCWNCSKDIMFTEETEVMMNELKEILQKQREVVEERKAQTNIPFQHIRGRLNQNRRKVKEAPPSPKAKPEIASTEAFPNLTGDPD